jgi:hypothetical protein
VGSSSMQETATHEHTTCIPLKRADAESSALFVCHAFKYLTSVHLTQTVPFSRMFQCYHSPQQTSLNSSTVGQEHSVALITHPMTCSGTGSKPFVGQALSPRLSQHRPAA